MTINTAYLGTPTDDTYGSNASTVFSDVSLTGTLDAAAVEGTTSITGGTVAGTTATFSSTITGTGITGTTGAFTSTLSANGIISGLAGAKLGGGTTVAKISSATVAVVAMTCAANQSTTTTFTWSGATIANDTTDPDTYLVATKSAFSADVVVDAYASDKDTVTLRYSNVSSAAAVFAAQTMRVTRIEF